MTLLTYQNVIGITLFVSEVKVFVFVVDSQISHLLLMLSIGVERQRGRVAGGRFDRQVLGERPHQYVIIQGGLSAISGQLLGPAEPEPCRPRCRDAVRRST